MQQLLKEEYHDHNSLTIVPREYVVIDNYLTANVVALVEHVLLQSYFVHVLDSNGCS